MDKKEFLDAFNKYYEHLLKRLDNGSIYLDSHPEVKIESSIYKAYEEIISELKEMEDMKNRYNLFKEDRYE